jgi:spore coat protein H
MLSMGRPVRLYAGLALALCGCASESSGEVSRDADDPAAKLYARNRLLEVAIELDDADWDVIRHEGQTASAILSGCQDRGFEYSEVPARVTVDGVAIEHVAVRKKGYLGSLSAQRPSLKVDFDDQIDDQNFEGSAGLTLNNNRQDPTNARSCLAYALFARASVHAPACNFAHVTLNGQDLGFYTNVESIKKPFLARSFGDDSGNLYEGQGADFRQEWLPFLEKKTNEREADFSDVEQLSAALTAPDDQLLDALEPILDIDAFVDFWASEVLIGHWDGYNGDLNNFYLYNDPSNGRFYFIPWGTDGTFQLHSLLPQAILPRSLLAWAELPRRLYAIDSVRQRYRARLRAMLDEVWDGDFLLHELERIAALTGAPDSALDPLRSWIESWPDQLRAELDGAAPTWPIPPRETAECNDRSTPIEAHFDTSFGSLDDLRPGQAAEFSLELDGAPQEFGLVLASAGPLPEDPSQAGVRVLGARADNALLLIQLSIPTREVMAGSVPTHGLETVGIVVQGDAKDATNFRILGIADSGVLVLDAAGTRPGDPITGHFEGRFTPAALQ